MLFSKIHSKFVLFTLIICIFTYPSSSIAILNAPPPIRLQVSHTLPTYQQYDLTSYDSILQLIEDITNGGIQDKSPEQLESINRIISLLAEQGSLTTDPELLQEDIAELLGLRITPCGYVYTCPGTLLCGNWVKKQWKKTTIFVKKHKKAIIIGAAIVVAIVVVAGVAYGTTAAAIPGVLGSSVPEPTKSPNIRSTAKKRVDSIKETIQNISDEEILEPIDPAFSIEENARILGELLIYQNLDEQNYQEVQKVFSVNYLANIPIDTTKSFEENFHEVRGEYALQRECYEQALYDFNKIIETNPDNGSAYLSRASAYERIGDYPAAIEDYQQYQEKNTWDCTTEFTLGFTKGLASGVKDAGVEFGGFIADCVTHPIDTSANIWKSCTLLKDLVATADWDTISQILSPDAHKLITNWDALSMEERGELAGHAFGKHGGDFLIPGTTSKVVSAGLSEVKQLGKVCKTLKNAEKSVVLEGITEEGVSIAVKGDALIDKLCNAIRIDKVFIKGPNVGHHVLQEKHAWDKLIGITGNVEKDFSQVIKLLEESRITQQKPKKQRIVFMDPTTSKGIIRSDYRTKINGYNVEAVFETHTDTGKSFLQNAWVIKE